MTDDTPQDTQPHAHGWNAGDIVGPYHVLDLIGEGGFGSVYLAEQREPVRRRVALKVIKPGMDSKEVIARFEAERQALAMMDHPNVAHVFDAGMTPRGRPYFAMEHVPGVPITDYCDEHKLSTAERIELFIPVCNAVQHAHQKGVIHRDLKPSNILVTLFDHKPVPKVIDFGIAKATSQQLTTKTLYTEAGRMIGTPEYMSPEQAGTSGLDIDTRADVYSLGVILYQLLSGSLPFETVKLRSSGPDGIIRAIKEDEPPKLSSRVASTDTKTAAQLRRSDTRTLLRELRGDLDWISMRAMEKDRSRRYETANALAMDLRRYLNHEPVLARPPSTGYRLSRFVRKHRVGVGAGALVGLALIAGTVGTGWGMVEARSQRDTAVSLGRSLEQAKADAEQQRDAAQQQRDEAQRLRTAEAEARTAAELAANQAEAVTAFMVDLLGMANPDVSERADLTVRELLDKAAADVGRAFQHQPRAEARVRTEIGRAYGNVGDLESAKNQLARALEIRDALPGSTPAEIHQALWPYATVLRELSEADWRAQELRGLELGRDVVRAEHAELATALDELWRAVEPVWKFGNYDRDRAQRARQRAVREAGSALTAKDPKWIFVGDYLMVLGDRIAASRAGNLEGRLALAADYLRESVEMYRRCLAETNTRIARAQKRRFEVLRDNGEPDKAQAVARQALEVLERTLGPDHWYTARFAVLRAVSLIDLKEFAEAERLLDAAQPVIAKVLGEHSLDGIAALNCRQDLFEAWGKPDEVAALRLPLAETRARSTAIPGLGTVRRVLGPEHELTLAMERLDIEVKRDSPAVGRILTEVIELRRALPDGDPRGAVIGNVLARWGNDLFRRNPSQPYSQRMLEEAVRLSRGWQASHLDFALDMLGWVHRRPGRYAEAEPYCREGVAVCTSAFGERHPRTLWHLAMLGRCLRGTGQFKAAETKLETAFDGFVAIEGPTSYGAMGAFASLVELYVETDRRAEAVRFAAARLRSLLDTTVSAKALAVSSRAISDEAGLDAESYALALEGATRAFEADPKDQGNRIALGLAQYRLGQRERAWETLAEVYALDPATLRIVIGEGLAELGQAVERLSDAVFGPAPASAEQHRRVAASVRAAVDDLRTARVALALDDPRATLVAGTLHRIGASYGNSDGDREQVLRILEDAVTLARAAEGGHLLGSLWWLATAHSNLQHPEGIPIIEEYIERARTRYGDATGNVANGQRILGALLLKLGKPGGEAMLLEGYRGLVATLGHLDGNTANTFERVTGLFASEGRIEEAARVAAERLQAVLDAGGADANTVHDPTWIIVRCPELEPELYELALRGAEWATEAMPDNRYLVNTLATAQYRASRLDDALKTVLRSIELAETAEPPQPPHPVDYAVLAMTQRRMGQHDGAHASIARARELMSDNQPFANDNDSKRFLAEAVALIDGK